jgi:hypothetical protein
MRAKLEAIEIKEDIGLEGEWVVEKDLILLISPYVVIH